MNAAIRALRFGLRMPTRRACNANVAVRGLPPGMAGGSIVSPPVASFVKPAAVGQTPVMTPPDKKLDAFGAAGEHVITSASPSAIILTRLAPAGSRSAAWSVASTQRRLRFRPASVWRDEP
jgi:hypothetical protein